MPPKRGGKDAKAKAEPPPPIPEFNPDDLVTFDVELVNMRVGVVTQCIAYLQDQLQAWYSLVSNQ
jgi:hypothetical protein